MLCWGSWANTQKLASKEWRFQLFYWDYAIGVMLLALVLAFTLGSTGSGGRPFLADLSQADAKWLGSAFLGGVDLQSGEHPPGGRDRYRRAGRRLSGGSRPGAGVGRHYHLHLHARGCRRAMCRCWPPALRPCMVAILLDAVAYKRLASGNQKTPAKGIVLSVVAGLLMGFFYMLRCPGDGPIDPVDQGLGARQTQPLHGHRVIFGRAVGVEFPLEFDHDGQAAFGRTGPPLGDYFSKGNARLHAIGILGGAIWNVGMSFSIVAAPVASPALSYGLGQGATMVGAFWGVFIWKEFQKAPRGTNPLLAAMFAFYLLGLGILIASKLQGTS